MVLIKILINKHSVTHQSLIILLLHILGIKMFVIINRSVFPCYCLMEQWLPLILGFCTNLKVTQ